MKVFNLALALSLNFLFLTNLNAYSLKEAPITYNPPKLMVVKFHADWCGSCKTLGPAITDLTNKLDGKPVLFTELNFTNTTTKNQTLLLASALGLEKVVQSNSGTGFILVIDTKTKEIKAKLDKTQSVKEMGKIISGLL